MANHQSPRGKFPNYWCRIKQPTRNIDILADLPEEFSYQATSHYDGPVGTVTGMASTVLNDIPVINDLTGAVAGAAGSDAAYQPFTKRLWRGTEPIQFSLKLLFDAENNTREDVHKALVQLASIALPAQDYMGGQVLTSPNPARFSDKDKCEIWIGKQYYWDSVVVMSATPASESRFDSEGYPIAGAIDLQICTDYSYGKKDLYRAAGIEGDAWPGTVARGDRTDAPGLSPVQMLRMRRGDG